MLEDFRILMKPWKGPRKVTRVSVALICAGPLLFGQAGPQPRIESNVLYGMYSGLALLMDVYYPEKPNGYGVIFISGSGWRASQEYNAEPLKQGGQAQLYGPRLTAAGYTVFSISHRAAPRFRYPAQVEDAQRAVRFVRHNAARFNVRADRIGAVGGSSGGHLVESLGVLDGAGIKDDPDPINRESAKVQCVVARAAPADLARMTVTEFMGMSPPDPKARNTVEDRAYRAASPIQHVSPDSAPILLIHGDADKSVPFEQSEMMERALRAAGVPTHLLRIPGGGHGPTFAGATNPPDYMGEMVRWLDRYLKQ
jgi:acetyl esterase/lipase